MFCNRSMVVVHIFVLLIMITFVPPSRCGGILKFHLLAIPFFLVTIIVLDQGESVPGSKWRMIFNKLD